MVLTAISFANGSFTLLTIFRSYEDRVGIDNERGCAVE